jgi:hypothetical protein
MPISRAQDKPLNTLTMPVKRWALARPRACRYPGTCRHIGSRGSALASRSPAGTGASRSSLQPLTGMGPDGRGVGTALARIPVDHRQQHSIDGEAPHAWWQSYVCDRGGDGLGRQHEPLRRESIAGTACEGPRMMWDVTCWRGRSWRSGSCASTRVFLVTVKPDGGGASASWSPAIARGQCRGWARRRRGCSGSTPCERAEVDAGMPRRR